jgi:hypothetical protein
MTIGLSTSGAIKIKTDGGLRAVSCGCCGPMIIFYSYDTHPGLGGGFDQCPEVGAPCGDAESGSCIGAVARGFLYSDPWGSLPTGKTAKAKIYAGACMDDYGSIGTATAGEPGSCEVGFTSEDVIDTAQVESDPQNLGKFRMKIPFEIFNNPQGGPYGVCGAVIEWYWE